MTRSRPEEDEDFFKALPEELTPEFYPYLDWNSGSQLARTSSYQNELFKNFKESYINTNRLIESLFKGKEKVIWAVLTEQSNVRASTPEEAHWKTNLLLCQIDFIYRGYRFLNISPLRIAFWLPGTLPCKLVHFLSEKDRTEGLRQLEQPVRYLDIRVAESKEGVPMESMYYDGSLLNAAYNNFMNNPTGPNLQQLGKALAYLPEALLKEMYCRRFFPRLVSNSFFGANYSNQFPNFREYVPLPEELPPLDWLGKCKDVIYSKGDGVFRASESIDGVNLETLPNLVRQNSICCL